MPRFAFEAISPSGAIVRGSIEAQSSGVALEQLIAGGQTPVSLREATDKEGILSRASRLVGWHGFDYALMLRELGVLLKAGMPVERALNALLGVSPNGRHALRVRQILDRVRAGEPLSQAFASVVREAPAHIARLVAAGEASGKLAEVVTRLAAALARAKASRDKLVSGLTYPAVLVVAMSIVLWVVFTSVLPRLTPMFEDAGASLPVATGFLLAIESFLNSYGLILLALIAFLIAAFVYALRRPDLRLGIDRFFLGSRLTLDLPRRYEAARFCRNLETLLDGGLTLEKALAAARDGAANSWFRQRIAGAQSAVADGERLKVAFAGAAVLPPLVMEFAAVGEETGRLGAMMGEVAAILDHDVETRLQRLTALVVPAATLFMGGLVAGVMAGVVSGILAVNDLAQ